MSKTKRVSRRQRDFYIPRHTVVNHYGEVESTEECPGCGRHESRCICYDTDEDADFNLSVTFNTAEKQERYLRRCLQTAFDQMMESPRENYLILAANYDRIKQTLDCFDAEAYEVAIARQNSR